MAMDKMTQKQIDSWLTECPVTVITNVENRTPLEFIAQSIFPIPEGHTFTSLDDFNYTAQQDSFSKYGRII